MPTYLTHAKFCAIRTGYEMPIEEFSKIAPIADAVINGQIGAAENVAFPSESLLKAVAYQTGFIYANGGAEGVGAPLTGERIGGYSWTARDENAPGIPLHPIVHQLLLRTGLLYRGAKNAR